METLTYYVKQLAYCIFTEPGDVNEQIASASNTDKLEKYKKYLPIGHKYKQITNQTFCQTTFAGKSNNFRYETQEIPIDNKYSACTVSVSDPLDNKISYEDKTE